MSIFRSLTPQTTSIVYSREKNEDKWSNLKMEFLNIEDEGNDLQSNIKSS